MLRGTRNVFTVRVPEAETLECRLKGKVLKGMEGFYNPLAPGDRVMLERDPRKPGAALILSALLRESFLARFNQKGRKPQVLAANVDAALCLTSPASPPFRPRFLDRALVQAKAAGIGALILVNKADLLPGAAGGLSGVEARLSDYERAGYRVMRVSAKTGRGLGELAAFIAGKKTVLFGQSGVGKTSLVNALVPGIAMRTGLLNEKYDRGNHTTSLSVMLEVPAASAPGDTGRAWIIDTPGIRRMIPWGVTPSGLALCMKEFAPFAGICAFGFSCSHTHESGCAIRAAVSTGAIHEDRYESFLRILDELGSP